MPTVESSGIKQHANVFRNITETPSLDAVQNVLVTANAQRTWLALTTSAKIHALEHAVMKLSAQFSITYQLAHARKEQPGTLLNNAKSCLNMKHPLKKIHAIHHRVEQERFAGNLEARLCVNVSLDTLETHTSVDVIPNARLTPIAHSQKHVPTTNAWILVKERFVDTTQNAQLSITFQFVHARKKWLAIRSLNASQYQKSEILAIHHHVHEMEFAESLTELHLVNILNAFRTKIARHRKHVSIKSALILVQKHAESTPCVMLSIIRQFVHVQEVSSDHRSKNVRRLNKSLCLDLSALPMTNVQTTKHVSTKNVSTLAQVQTAFVDRTQNVTFKLTDRFASVALDSLETPNTTAMKSDVDQTMNVHQLKHVSTENVQILVNSRNVDVTLCVRLTTTLRLVVTVTMAIAEIHS